MSLFNLLLYIYYLCCLVTKINGITGCNFVAVDWDALEENIKTLPITRAYELGNDTTYLPPFPKVFGPQDNFNESFALIPYPTETCLETYKDSPFQSYKFVCSNKEAELRTYVDTECANIYEIFDSKIIQQLELWPKRCDAEVPCPYVSITETYYEEDHMNNTDECQNNIDNNDNRLSDTPEYISKYAVNVCLTYDQMSYKYACETRTKTYTTIIYDNNDCSGHEHIKTGNIECTPYFDVTDDEILNVSVKSSFIECTSIDEFKETYADYCVSSQVIIVESSELKSIIPQFGPFGIEHVPQTALSHLNTTNTSCNLCDVSTTCNVLNETILLVDEDQTQYIMNNCSANTFVQDIESTSNIEGIIFTSDGTSISYISDENDITIPTRIINRAYNLNVGDVSLTCNYRRGYPQEICISVKCNHVKRFTDKCDNIMFAGTYLIQSKTAYNSNPTWIKQQAGDISEQYIWLTSIVIDDNTKLADIKPYVQLRWVVSSQLGNTNNSLYCDIKDVNDKTYENQRDKLSNFDVVNCEWKSIALNINNTSINVATAPYQCFDNTNSVPIAFTCLNTYKTTNISSFRGQYYEIAAGSNIYIKKDDTQLAVLKRGYKFQNCNDKNIYYTSPVESDDDTLALPCKIIETSNISWILYIKQGDDYEINAYCDISSLSVTSCNKWFVYNEDSGEYERDNSFDVDYGNECGKESELSYGEYSDKTCFQLMSNTSIIYSQVQYLWGQYDKLQVLFNGRPMYQNIKLANTPFDTYIIWYDPIDSWVFITRENFYKNTKTNLILDDFTKLSNLFTDNSTDIIVAYCNDNKLDVLDNYNSIKPEECKTGWIINNIFYNVTDISLLNNKCMTDTDYNITFQKKEKIVDLCLAFYGRDNECILPGETYNALNTKPSECETPQYFQIAPLCYDDEDEKCEVDGNGIYTQFKNSPTISNRSFWIMLHEDKTNNDTIFSYIYYHTYLRLWMWTYIEEFQLDCEIFGENISDTCTLEELTDKTNFTMTAWCLKWDINIPSECVEFYYYDNDNILPFNASTIVDDCTIEVDNNPIYAQEISGWIIVSCLGLACCVFVIGFYKEYMERRNKKKGTRVSILPDKDDTQIAMVQHAGISVVQPETITEERTGDVRAEETDNDNLNRVISASSTDILSQ